MLQSEHGERRLDHAVRRQADRIDVLANQKVGDFGIVRRGLSADADVAVVALRPLDRELQYGQTPGSRSSNSKATISEFRSTPSTSWVRSLEPIDRRLSLTWLESFESSVTVSLVRALFELRA